MHSTHIQLFYDPFTLQTLEFESFELIDDDIKEGIFYNIDNGNTYAIHLGVPVFLKDAIPKFFLQKHKPSIDALKIKFPNLRFVSNDNDDWSFSNEWSAHENEKMDTTWGLTTESRVEQFFYETQETKDSVHDKVILDAGCGNALLTNALSDYCKLIIGADFSSSVYFAEKNRKSNKVLFIQCDLRFLPFKDKSIDVIVSNGVIHHTDNTEITFNLMSNKTKIGGKCYIWLYSRKGSFLWQVKRLFFDFLRMIFSRTPSFIQNLAVNLLTTFIFILYRFTGKKIDKKTLHVDMYDSITPRWRFYHTPEEVAQWYYNNGFAAPVLTHWHNRYGFGVNAIRLAHDNVSIKTPGEYFIL